MSNSINIRQGSIWRDVIAFAPVPVLIYFWWLLVLLTLPYLRFEATTDFLEGKQSVYHLWWWQLAFYAHIISSPIVLICGITQFIRAILRNAPKVHRLLGKIYIVLLLFVSAPGGLFMALYANGGIIVQTSFTMLSLLWIYFTVMAYRQVRRKKFDSHVRFMLRSFALALSAISLRLYAQSIIPMIGLRDADAYTFLSLASWIPNLLAAELLARTGFMQGKRLYNRKRT